MDGSRVTFFALGSRHTRPSIDDRGGNLCICLRQGSAKSRLLRSVAGANNPEFLRPTLRVITLRPHVMNLVVETDSLVDGQRQRPKSLQKEASDSFDSMLLPTSRIMRAAREKIMQTSQRPRVLHHSQLCRCLRRQKHVGLLCHRKCLMRARSRVFCGLLVQCHKAVA